MSASLCETVIMCCVNVKKCLDPVFLKMLCYKHAIKRTIITDSRIEVYCKALLSSCIVKQFNVVHNLLQTAYDESELNVLQATADSDADSDDEIGSFHDDGPDSSDQDAIDEDADSLENGGKAKDHDLEWDSSTVSY